MVGVHGRVSYQRGRAAGDPELPGKRGRRRLGSDGDITVVDMDKEGMIDVNKLHSKNKPSPWHGWKVKGMPILTVVRGHVQMRDGEPCGKAIGKALKPLI